MKAPAIGELDRRIDVQRSTSITNSFNEPVTSWWLLARVYAHRADVSDGERMRAGAVAGEISTRFTVRWSEQLADVSNRDRINYAGRIYNIVAVKEIGRRQYLELSTSARSDEPESHH